jgi:hypothetical protein
MAILNLRFPDTDLPIALDCNDDRFYWAWRAVMSQSWLKSDDRQRARTERFGYIKHDEGDARSERLVAMNDWSIAVRNGFVDC